MNELKNIDLVDFDKLNGLAPVVIQDNDTMKVLMVGFMNKEALQRTVKTGKVKFFGLRKPCQRTLYPRLLTLWTD